MKRSNAKESLSYHICLGVLLGVLLIPPQAAHAQFVVHDPGMLAKHVETWIEEVERWKQTIEHYGKVYDNMVGQLKVITTQLVHIEGAISVVNRIGELLKGAAQLYTELNRMVNLRYRALQQIVTTIRAGKFDAATFRTVFGEYVKFTMGRSPRDTLSRLERLARIDTELAAWLDEKQDVEATIAAMTSDVRALQKQLEAEQALGTKRRNIQNLNDQIIQYFNHLEQLNARYAELNRLITERVNRHGERFQEMENFARQVTATNNAWTRLIRTKNEISRTVDRIVAGQ